MKQEEELLKEKEKHFFQKNKTNSKSRKQTRGCQLKSQDNWKKEEKKTLELEDCINLGLLLLKC